LYFNSLTELCLYFSYVHVLRFVSRLLNQNWIGLDWFGIKVSRSQELSDIFLAAFGTELKHKTTIMNEHI